ncbi:hypothetical protein SAMN05216532_0713 [Streptomyces sp. 2231.1]|nr:hypothetical protein SAMN05216532_0713 [Streptomyces sp. 2231.1]
MVVVVAAFDDQTVMDAQHLDVGGLEFRPVTRWWTRWSHSATKRLRGGAGRGRGDVRSALRESSTAIRDRLGELLTGAQRAGAVRPELSLPELLALPAGIGRAMEQLGADPAGQERIFEVVFAGLRPH